MQNLNIETTQNIDIEYTYASLVDRMLATLIDLVIMLVYVLILFLTAEKFQNFTQAMFIGFIAVPLSIYHILFEQFLDGQSIGKKIMKTKVVKMDGTQASFINYTIRWVFRLIENVGFLVYSIPTLTYVLNQKGQRLGDIAAGTTVIKLKSSVDLDDSFLFSVSDDHEVTYPQVTELADEDVEIIREAYQYYEKNPQEIAAMEVILKAKIAVEKKLNIKGEGATHKFIETVLKDYTFLNK
jgi:uncharacterized RDD family membrane protein YckC